MKEDKLYIKTVKEFNENTNKNFEESLYIIILIFPLITTLLVEYFHKGTFKDLIEWILCNPQGLIYNYIINFAIAGFFCIIKKGRYYMLSSSIITLIFCIIAKIAFIKEVYRGEPLYLSDLMLIKEAMGIASSYDIDPLKIILIFTSILILIVAVFTTKFKIKPSTKISRIAFLSSICIFIIMTLASYKNIIKMKITVAADNLSNHSENGVLLGIYLEGKFLNIQKPSDYTEKTVNNILKYYEPTKNNPQIKPNVIFVLLESFWDIDKQLDLPIKGELMPNFTNERNNSIWGYTTVPNMGGGTANTEFEALTGFSKNYMSSLNIPYNAFNQYIDKPTLSIASALKEWGYGTFGVHTYTSWFYNRNKVYKNLGIDKFISLDTLEHKPTMYSTFIDDETIYKLTEERLRETEERDFVNAVTMMSHGDYIGRVIKNNNVELNKNYSESANLELNAYLKLINHTDRRFGEFLETLKNFPEPTIVVAYGDHSPSLSKETFEEIGKEYGSKKTPYLIWSNYGAFKNENLDIDIADIPSLVLTKIGMNNNKIFTIQNTLRENKKLNVYTDEQLFHDISLVQYDILHGDNYSEKILGTPYSNKDYTIGEKLEIKRAFIEERDKNMYLILEGSGFTYNGHLLINDEEVDYQLNDNNSLSAVIKEEQINNDNITIQFQTKNLRDVTVQKSNIIECSSINDLKNESKNQDFWKEIKINGQQYWFPYKDFGDSISFYINLDLEQTTYKLSYKDIYFTEKDPYKMSNAYESTIYSNGCLYVSIPKNLLEDKNKPVESFKKLLDKENLILKIHKNNP